MKALTVHAPWGWAIAHAGKSIENRSWAPPESIIGQRIAIHQGLRLDPDAVPWMLEWQLIEVSEVPIVHVRGAIVATAVVAGWYDRDCEWPEYTGPSCWFVGPIGWRLTNVVALPEPIPCKGAQGLWVVPPAALERIPAQAR